MFIAILRVGGVAIVTPLFIDVGYLLAVFILYEYGYS